MQFVDPDYARNVLRTFGHFGLEAGLVSPTITAMEKSIMDATAPFRDFLRATGIHDFMNQDRGPMYKVRLQANYVTRHRLFPTTISLYRPITKEGDPRVWFYGLREFALPNDVLALIQVDGQLFIVNASDDTVMAGIANPSTPLGQLVVQADNQINPEAAELLGKLRSIRAQGFLPTVRTGDTGVGATLEAWLGIPSNSSRLPDYKGIEIKASRQNEREPNARNRVNLFSQVPDWTQSATRTAYNALQSYGYQRDGRQQLYCTVHTLEPNSQGLFLTADVANGYLHVNHTSNGVHTNVMVWELEKLRKRLVEKHPESFWVKAESAFINGVEHFRYHTVFHTIRPLVTNLAQAIAEGVVSLDLTMSDKGGRVRDHGYLFKIWPSDLEVLFPKIRIHNL